MSQLLKQSSLILKVTVILMVLEVRSSELFRSDEGRNKNNSVESVVMKASLDSLVKNPIRNFFSRIDQFFTDFIESRMPFFEEKSRVPIGYSGFTKLFGNEVAGNGAPKNIKTQFSSANSYETPFSSVDSEHHLGHNDHKYTFTQESTSTRRNDNSKLDMLVPTDKHDHKPDVNGLTLGWFSAFNNPLGKTVKSRQRRLADDDAINETDYPYLIQVYNQGVYLMNGVSTSVNTAVTSASGLRGKDGQILNPSQIILKSLSGDKSKIIEHRVRDIHLHPDYKHHSSGNDSRHDVALLRIVETPEKFAHFNNISFTESEPKVSEECLIVTWEHPGDEYRIKKTDVKLSENSRCKSLLDTFNEKEECCASDTRSGADRGSPLVCSGMLTGILSWTNENEKSAPVEIYAKLIPYKNAIDTLQLRSMHHLLNRQNNDTENESNKITFSLVSSNDPNAYQDGLKTILATDFDGRNSIEKPVISHCQITAFALVSVTFYIKDII